MGRSSRTLGRFSAGSRTRADLSHGWCPSMSSILTIERTLPASRERVYEAFADADRLAGWWGPEGFEIPHLDYEPRVGRQFRIEMAPPQGDAFQLAGEFREVVPPTRIAFTFQWEP